MGHHLLFGKSSNKREKDKRHTSDNQDQLRPWQWQPSTPVLCFVQHATAAATAFLKDVDTTDKGTSRTHPTHTPSKTTTARTRKDIGTRSEKHHHISDTHRRNTGQQDQLLNISKKKKKEQNPVNYSPLYNKQLYN